jgi:hypothetical protein
MNGKDIDKEFDDSKAYQVKQVLSAIRRLDNETDEK